MSGIPFERTNTTTVILCEQLLFVYAGFFLATVFYTSMPTVCAQRLCVWALSVFAPTDNLPHKAYLMNFYFEIQNETVAVPPARALCSGISPKSVFIPHMF